MRVSHQILAISSCIVLSHLLHLIGKKTRIPAVLLLMFTGFFADFLINTWAPAQGLPVMAIDTNLLYTGLRLVGTLGLIMIILEASLDLKLSRKKIPTMRLAALVALLTFVANSAVVTLLLHFFYGGPWIRALIIAVPFAIMSSSIIISSIKYLSEPKRDHMIYETAVSDIVGIMVFYFLIYQTDMGYQIPLSFFLNITGAVLAAALALAGLLFIVIRTSLETKHYFVIGLLATLYAGTRLAQMPAFLVILLFGLMLNNLELLPRPLRSRLRLLDIHRFIRDLKTVTAESAFVVKTFFFILFGLYVGYRGFTDPEVWSVGTLIVLALFIIRVVALKSLIRTDLRPELYILPRGLITILLFYSIPEPVLLEGFNERIVPFVEIVTCLIMFLGFVTAPPTAFESRTEKASHA